ncbi:NAD(P)/FAD-dependent oxidoreductase [Pseudooceanicola sp. LIPI14-2-Ac024]|uniref:NAD(P)/FAD-dependent oxidoreductase n=1 Tax=Pseudooceanicola sp. LIPI14-2-Ac024 TaxID=3344875 RepID=UPI0035CF57B7
MAGHATYDAVVIGAGIAGASVAAELAREMRVLLVEAEDQPGYHATGRSAAILAQTYGSEVIRALTAASAGFLAAPPDGFADAPLLTPRGLAIVADAAQVDALRAGFEAGAEGDYMDWQTPGELEARIPLLRPGYAAGGLYNAAARDIDVHGLLSGYLRLLRRRGGTLRTATRVHRLTRRGTGWEIAAEDDILHAGLVVNAAGAWADGVGALAHAQPQRLEPMRRSAITFAPPAGVDPGMLPMVVDADERFYLKPEAGRLMASPADETVSAPCDSRPEEIDIAICIDRITRAFDLQVSRVLSSWSGLRTFVPDRAPICGFDPAQVGFFWLAGQGGYGVQTAPAMARLAASMIRGEAPDKEITASGLKLDDIAPGRFAPGQNNDTMGEK